jgi:hypothetical protein
VTVEDPAALATGASSLVAGAAGERLKPVRMSGRAIAFPVTVTVANDDTGTVVLWVEARDDSGAAMARGTTEIRFTRTGATAATIILEPACDVDRDCDDGLFCTGEESCTDGTCSRSEPPCASSIACANLSCVEGTDGAGECAVQIDHALCPAGQYCSPTVGCTDGDGCHVDADCQDDSVCNGEEECFNFFCRAGPVAEVDDDDPCTLDGCSDARTLDGLEPIFHFPDPTRDGNPCDLAAGGSGICRAELDGCVSSSCGDDFVDLLASEVCDDGNTDDCVGDCAGDCSRAVTITGLGCVSSSAIGMAPVPGERWP